MVGSSPTPSGKSCSPARKAATGPAAWLLVFRSAYEADRLAEVLDCVEPAWGAEAAAAIADGAEVAARGLRGAAQAIVSGVRWSKANFVEHVDAHDEAATVDPAVRAAVATARDVAVDVASVGEQVVYAVAGAAFVAGQTITETAEAAGMLEWQETSQGRAATKVASTGLRAARDVFSELSGSLSDIWSESAQAVTDAVQHTSGHEAAAVTAQALEAGGAIGGTAMSLAPTVLARKAVFAGVLGANKIEVPGAEDASADLASGLAELQSGVAGLLALEEQEGPLSADEAAARHLDMLSGACLPLAGADASDVSDAQSHAQRAAAIPVPLTFDGCVREEAHEPPLAANVLLPSRPAAQPPPLRPMDAAAAAETPSQRVWREVD